MFRAEIGGFYFELLYRVNGDSFHLRANKGTRHSTTIHVKLKRAGGSNPIASGQYPGDDRLLIAVFYGHTGNIGDCGGGRFCNRERRRRPLRLRTQQMARLRQQGLIAPGPLELSGRFA